MSAFVTSFGRKIDLVPGYRDRHRHVDNTAIFGSSLSLPFGIDGFIKDVYEYALMVDFLESLGRPSRWDRALDIGGGEGTVSRLLRGQGKARHSTTIEIEDFRPRLSTRVFMREFLKYRAGTLAAGILPGLRRFLVSGEAWWGRRLTAYYYDFGWMPQRGSNFWRLSIRRPPVVGEYVIGDVYDLAGPFDLITAFSCLVWFDVGRLFRKVRSLLAPGGTFFMLGDCWWHPVNSTYIVGHFPHACQRLTLADFERYVTECHADERADLLARYRYPYHGQLQPTLDDLVDIAAQAGLELMGAQRLIPPVIEGGKGLPTPRYRDREDEAALEDVLADIRCFRTDVRRTDLMTSWMVAPFMRRAA